MPIVNFEHNQRGANSLAVETGADAITWSYGLNTQTYPTYGGEVVQILSTYIDDLQIKGTCRNYAWMERIHTFFLNYIQGATQPGQFDLSPMIFTYPNRGWSFKIQPKNLPAFRYATELTAPEWSITAQIVESDPAFDRLTLEMAMKNGFQPISGDDVNKFVQLRNNIGFTLDNPFSSPDGNKYNTDKVNRALNSVGDWWGSLIHTWTSGDPAQIQKELFSKPSFGTNPGGTQSRRAGQQ